MICTDYHRYRCTDNHRLITSDLLLPRVSLKELKKKVIIVR